MADYTVTLTDAQRDALIANLESSVGTFEDDLEAHLIAIANVKIEKDLDNEFKEKTLSEKQTLLSE